VGNISIFAAKTFYWSIVKPPSVRVVIPLMYEIGVRSVPVILGTGSFIGMVLAVQMFTQMHKLGVEAWAGPVINVAMVKEIGPVLAAVILAGRIGGAMAAELGTMRVTEQIDALRSMGTDPIQYLVVPRFYACFLLIPILTIISDFIGALCGYLVSTKALGVSSFYYIVETQKFLESWDIAVGIIKSFFFGAFIAIICCYKGFHARGGAEGVGRATTSAFVAAFVAILVSNFFLAVLLRFINYHIIKV
jgi:phospholipid/cholesterol/gamma-HCH transport system permease protein